MELMRKQITDKNKESLKSNIREHINSVPDPEHGGNIYKIAEETGIPADKLIDFSASVNPLGISKKVKNVIKKELDNLVNYPDTDTNMLRKKLSRHHDINPETILCGNGSTELIYLIPRALKPEKVLITAPTFSEYAKACKLGNESRVMSYELKKENNFGISPDEFISAMKGERTSELRTPDSRLTLDMAFLCNPNNPTGGLLKKEEVLKIAEAAREMGCVLIVDEAFIDFIPEESVIHDVENNKYLVVLRSMTKFYALTGLRVGYGVFHEDLIGRIKKFKEPWTVNNLAQKAAVAALDDSEYKAETFRHMEREREFIEKQLAERKIEYFPSFANYYMLRIKDAERVVTGLREKGILVRDCSNFNGLSDSYIRIAVKSRRENTMLFSGLSEL
jgi:threonine-phosphate decarboxylase